MIYNKCSIVADSLHVYIEAQVYYKKYREKNCKGCV